MKMKAYPSFDAYLEDQSARNQPLIKALRSLVKRVAPKLTESVKWGNGCWLGSIDPVAYVYSAPDHVQFGFFRGSRLEDPKKLLRGSAAWVRHIKVATVADIDESSFAALLREAVRLDGTFGAAKKEAAAPATKAATQVPADTAAKPRPTAPRAGAKRPAGKPTASGTPRRLERLARNTAFRKARRAGS